VWLLERIDVARLAEKTVVCPLLLVILLVPIISLADNDPQMPDAYMERALKYFKQNCVANWKGGSR